MEKLTNIILCNIKEVDKFMKKTDSEILAELIEKEMIYKKQKIYYSNIQKENAGDIECEEPTFLELYTPYKQFMKETTFAHILKIGSSILSTAKKQLVQRE